MFNKRALTILLVLLLLTTLVSAGFGSGYWYGVKTTQREQAVILPSSSPSLPPIEKVYRVAEGTEDWVTYRYEYLAQPLGSKEAFPDLEGKVLEIKHYPSKWRVRTWPELPTDGSLIGQNIFDVTFRPSFDETAYSSEYTPFFSLQFYLRRKQPGEGTLEEIIGSQQFDGRFNNTITQAQLVSLNGYQAAVSGTLGTSSHIVILMQITDDTFLYIEWLYGGAYDFTVTDLREAIAILQSVQILDKGE